MKLSKPPCYWDDNLRYHYRRCKDCGKKQYNYSGTWEDELTFERFLGKWSSSMGTGVPDVFVETGTEFEFNCYESWGRFFNVSVLKNEKWISVRGCENWNHTDWELRKAIDKTE